MSQMLTVAPQPARVLSIDLRRWTSFKTLRTGTRICIRPLRPDDRAREVAFIAALSEQARYFRMMSPLRFLSRHMLDQLMSIDYSQSMAFVATVGEGEAEYGDGAWMIGGAAVSFLRPQVTAAPTTDYAHS